LPDCRETWQQFRNETPPGAERTPIHEVSLDRSSGLCLGLNPDHSHSLTKIVKPIILLSCAIFFGGCAAQNGAPYDPPFAITPSDLNQADWVENAIARSPDLAGKYQVRPGSQSITVTFAADLPKDQVATVKANMQAMSTDLTRIFKKANKLIFRFKNVELQQ